MGIFCCKCRPFRASPVQKKIILLLVGLDNSGKTTAAKGLTGEIVNHAIPTIGFSTVKMKHKGFDVIIYDLGGGPQIRGIWSCYYGDVYGVIFVVDASDESRLEEAKGLLYNLLSHEKLAGKPLLVLANKQDAPNALDEIDIVELLRLEPLVNQQKCLTLVEVCSALSPENSEKIDSRLVRGYRWLIRQVINNYKELSQRVEQDTQEAQAALLVQRQEWIKRRSLEINRNGVHNKLDPVANGGLFAQTNGVLHSSPTRFSNKIKQQVDMADGRNRMKTNKVFPGKVAPPTAIESMTVRALTSPQHRPICAMSRQCSPQTKRPFTSKSLGTGEMKPWGLDEELRLVDFGMEKRANSPTAAHDLSPIEYFHSAAV
ncbi:ADP-ribosylation factor family [Nesidiocoris tenuis]|uniref:ADP-ribosylation factor family n=1 Tax=Nesidiocoris tenuis TaxID=355587 RepID=A0ABN7ARR7_9HEMI|nr:ADP-ribosylation factor family [Nesidiocoris tenuis]